MIVLQDDNNLIIDMPSTLKGLYPFAEVYLNGILISNSLSATKAIDIGVHSIKVILRSNSGSYTEKLCYLHDPDILCKIGAHLKSLNKEDQLKSVIPLYYYLINEGTKETTNCGCFCEDLKIMYQDIYDLMILNDC